MSPPVVVACLWVLGASAVGLAPRRWHWPAARALVPTGLSVLLWLALAEGAGAALLFLAGAGSILRWPIIRAPGRIRARLSARRRGMPRRLP